MCKVLKIIVFGLIFTEINVLRQKSITMFKEGNFRGDKPDKNARLFFL